MQLTLALLLFSGSAAQQSAVRPDATAVAVPIEIDLSSLEPLDPAMRTELARLLQVRVAEVIRGHAAPVGAIHLAVAWHDVARVDYAIALDIEARAGAGAQHDRRSTGPDTEQSELADVVEAALQRLLIDRREGPVAASIAAPGPGRPAPAARKVAPLGPMGWAGVGAAIAGVCSVGVGIGLLAIAPTPDPHDETKLRTWQPGGIAFSVLGGAAIVTGVALASVDGRRRAPLRRVAVRPWAPRRGAGLALAIRF